MSVVVIVMVNQVSQIMSVDEALTGHQWDISWNQSSVGASGSPQSPA